MLTVNGALNIIRKYGYNSKTSHPYLYLKGKDIGINYSYIDKKYGIIERIQLFKNEIDLENFLKKYQWYKLNSRNKNVVMELSDYESKNPKIIYSRNNHVMTDNEIFDLDNYDKKKESNKKLSRPKKILAEVENLIERYYIKKDEIERFVSNYQGKEEELKRYYADLQSLVNKYNNNEWDVDYISTINNYKIIDKEIDSINIKVSLYKNKAFKENDVLELRNRIWNLNKELEINSDFLKALQGNSDIDEELRLVNVKIESMKEKLNNKKFFRINLRKFFDKIDKSSNYVNPYNEEALNNYIDFINKKYDVLDKINEFRLSEYLNDFITNSNYEIIKNIKRCENPISSKAIDYDTEVNKIIDSLTKQYNKSLNDKERASLILYTSIYRKLFDMIMSVDNYSKMDIKELVFNLSELDGFNRIYNDCYTEVSKIIDLDINKNIKNKVFKNIDFTSKETFIDSLRDCIKVISNINSKMTLKDNLHLFFATSIDYDINTDIFINTSLNIAPLLVNKDNYQVFACDVNKGINVLFCPSYLKLPSINAYNQSIEIVNEPNPAIVLDNKDINVIMDEDINYLSKFKGNLSTKLEYCYISDFKLDFKVLIKNGRIEKRK